jgi:hypothetical protein
MWKGTLTVSWDNQDLRMPYGEGDTLDDWKQSKGYDFYSQGKLVKGNEPAEDWEGKPLVAVATIWGDQSKKGADLLDRIWSDAVRGLEYVSGRALKTAEELQS